MSKQNVTHIGDVHWWKTEHPDLFDGQIMCVVGTFELRFVFYELNTIQMQGSHRLQEPY